MTTVSNKPEAEDPRRHPGVRTSRSERRRGIRLLVISAVVAAAMFGFWWLVATTNREGHHDAELLPLFTLFTLAPALYHLAFARYLRTKGR